MKKYTTQDYIDYATKMSETFVDAMIMLDLMYANGDKIAGKASKKMQSMLDK